MTNPKIGVNLLQSQDLSKWTPEFWSPYRKIGYDQSNGQKGGRVFESRPVLSLTAQNVDEYPTSILVQLYNPSSLTTTFLKEPTLALILPNIAGL